MTVEKVGASQKATKNNFVFIAGHRDARESEIYEYSFHMAA